MIIEIVLKIVDFYPKCGYVHKDNLVGKAQILFFSSDSREGSIFQIWKWPKILRYDRFFKKIKIMKKNIINLKKI